MMKISKWSLKALTKAAGLFALAGANINCWWIAHDPVKPKELDKLVLNKKHLIIAEEVNDL